MVTLDRKDLVKYPFLKESQSFIGTINNSLDQFLDSSGGRLALKEAITTVEHALSFSGRETPSLPDISNEPEAVTIIVASYPLSRIVVSCAHDRIFIDRLVRYQAWLVFAFLQDEEPEVKRFIRRSIGLPDTENEISLVDYIPLASGMVEEKWRLINRVVVKGLVKVSPHEFDEIIRERLRYIMARNLPLKVPSAICKQIRPAVERIKAEWQKKVLEEFGQVEESAFPPCMQAILGAITSQGHLTHMARFAISAFLHNIGMENTRIIELYGSVPNFDLKRTMYQVEHITGRGGTSTEYTSPLCLTMKTHGICVHPDALCKKVTHPLTYYKRKKRELNRKGSGSASSATQTEPDGPGGKAEEQSGRNAPDSIPPRADGDHEEEKGT
ncbi:DNA primase regulatory subunit PriL [Methanospirillum sp.]|uniref:DNA primase regulatory subunit PriL n=1 Tax=Methanospirillum sp. TaxID=45200 RepID=UPI00359FA427